MNITREDTGTLTASLKVQVGSVDYEEKVQKTLKEYQKKANMPGFRPGKVPFGLISKMYRKAVILDEVNHLVSEQLQNYIEQNQLKLIGNPLPNREKSSPLDPDNIQDFELYFDIGMFPEFDLPISDKQEADYYNIKANDKMVDEYVMDLRKRYGTHHHHDGESHEETENNASSQEPEHEHEHDHDHHIEPAELNEEFFKMIFPTEEIHDVAAFREKIREGIEKSLVRESDRHFLNTVIEKLVDETKIELPDDFLRKTLRENEENPLSEEQVALQYENFAKSIKWQLIESKLVKDHGVRVEEEEMRNVVKSYFTGNRIIQEDNPEHEERLNKIADSVLSNREEATRLHNQIFDQKLLNYFKSNFTLKQKEIDYDDFVKMITEKQK